METPVKGFEIEHEFSVGSILSRSFSILFRNPSVYFGLALAAAIPTAIIDAASAGSETAGGASGLVDFILGLIIQGGIAYSVYQGLQDKKVTIGDTVSNGMSRIGSLIPLALLTGLCFVVGFLALIIPGIILMCMWAVVVQACVIEELGVMDSLRRSAELTKGYRMQIFGLMMLIGLCALALVVPVLLVLGAAGADSSAVGAVVISLITVPFVAFNSVVTAIIYADLRAIKEGATIDNLVSVFD